MIPDNSLTGCNVRRRGKPIYYADGRREPNGIRGRYRQEPASARRGFLRRVCALSRFQFHGVSFGNGAFFGWFAWIRRWGFVLDGCNGGAHRRVSCMRVARPSVPAFVECGVLSGDDRRRNRRLHRGGDGVSVLLRGFGRHVRPLASSGRRVPWGGGCSHHAHVGAILFNADAARGVSFCRAVQCGELGFLLCGHVRARSRRLAPCDDSLRRFGCVREKVARCAAACRGRVFAPGVRRRDQGALASRARDGHPVFHERPYASNFGAERNSTRIVSADLFVYQRHCCACCFPLCL